jgi:hypothetical protein
MIAARHNRFEAGAGDDLKNAIIIRSHNGADNMPGGKGAFYDPQNQRFTRQRQ